MPTSHFRAAAALAVGLLVALAGCRDAADPDSLDDTHALAEATAAPPFAQIAAGSSHSCGVTLDDVAYCWGDNNFGMLGDGTGQRRLAPVAVLGGLHFVQVSAGTTHTCGLATDGRAWCWGQNDLGQLGDGTAPTGHPTPVAVAGTRRFTQIRVGYRHTCALTTTGAPFCWGENAHGQLGNGSSTGPDDCSGVACSIRPIRAAGTRVFRQIKSGGEHTCALAEDRRVWCWGNNVFGQLGDGTVTTRLKPVAVSGDREFQQLSAGGMHTCGVDRSNRAWCWGRNELGQLGDGSTVMRRRSPVEVAGGFVFRGVSAGVEHTCATTTSDVVRCWGSNAFAQLGDGTTTNRTVPTRVAGSLHWSMVDAGWMTTCAITLGDRAYCWGTLTGDGTNALRPTPTAVAPPT
jgi:alpha-tubulin suppressor-like RCC1 family protein